MSPIEKQPSINFGYTYILGTTAVTALYKKNYRFRARTWEGGTAE